MTHYVQLAYLAAVVCFIVGLKKLSSPRTARFGNLLASLAMLIAIVATLLHTEVISFTWIIIGAVIGGVVGAVAAIRIQMTAMPEMVALFNGSGGIASALVALSEYMKTSPDELTMMTTVTIRLAILSGAVPSPAA